MSLRSYPRSARRPDGRCSFSPVHYASALAMPKPPRIPKSLKGKLIALDDHLYLLAEATGRLAGGETAYLKSLAAELRVLVCHSSRTEGLLWRLAEELRVPDTVHVHLPGDVDRDHPLARGLSFAFIPIFRAGEGDPRLAAVHHSLRSIIKECDAVFVSQRGYTHEKLIKAVAEQMGSAHEDEGVDPHLVELGAMLLGNRSPLTHILVSDSEYVLEVGNRVLDSTAESLGFRRKVRTPIVTEKPAAPEPQPEGQYLDEGGLTTLPPEGTVVFMVDHPHPDWRTNSHGYSFGQVAAGPLSVIARKHPDATMELIIAGLTGQPLTIRGAIPASNQPGVMVALTWGGSEIVIYLNGQQVHTIPRARHSSTP